LEVVIYSEVIKSGKIHVPHSDKVVTLISSKSKNKKWMTVLNGVQIEPPSYNLIS